jgi:hypothetical protein
MPTTYDIGDVVRTWGRFPTAEGGTTYTDPTVVHYALEKPDGGTSTASITQPATSTGQVPIVRNASGQYYVDVVTTGQGLYEWRYTSTGTHQTSQESWFSVRPRRVP